MTYAHHGRIRCYKISHPNPWCWEAECDCGWRIGAAAFDWPCAYWALVQHQTDLEPEWIVHPAWGAYWAIAEAATAAVKEALDQEGQS